VHVVDVPEQFTQGAVQIRLQVFPDKLYPPIQDVHEVGEPEQLLHGLWHCTQVDPESSNPGLQLVQDVAVPEQFKQFPEHTRLQVLPFKL